MTDDPIAFAATVLEEGGPLPWLAPRRQELSQSLPRLAEIRRCEGDAARIEAAARGLERLWSRLEPEELDKPAFGTPRLAAACLETASLLGIQLPPPPGMSEPDKLREMMNQHAREMSWPRVHVPLVNDEPARVFHTCHACASPPADDAVNDTAELFRRWFGIETPRWAFDRAAPGRSKMAALLVRGLFERWPDAPARLAQGMGSSRGWSHRGQVTFGITGELDERGHVLDVDGLEDKVRRFFQRFPGGQLFVPASRWREARRVADEQAPMDEPGWWPRVQRRWRVQPLRSVLDLLLRLGITAPAFAGTTLFQKLWKASERVTFWNGMSFDILKTVGTRYRPPPEEGGEEPEPVHEQEVLEGLHEACLANRSRLAYVEGPPGSGKSIALQRFAAELLSAALPLGAALAVNARDLVRSDLDLARALAHARPPLSLEECRQLLELARSKALAGGVWLVVDGLDEVSQEDRRRVRRLVDEWSGPAIIGARPLPDEAPGDYHFRILPLEEHQQRSLFALLGKSGHLEAIAAKPEQRGAEQDRRKAMLEDLCATPLGISLLAMLPESELGPSLNVQKVLREGVYTLLDRAHAAGRFDGDVLRSVKRKGLSLLGAAAWSMIRRGEATLGPDDLARMKGPLALENAVHAVLDNSDLVQRVGSASYQFSHKSLAELCAALHLKTRRGARRQLSSELGDPGRGAVAFHYGCLVKPKRRARFLQTLARNPHRPMSSLALGTRLLAATDPEPSCVPVAVELLGRYLRLASRLLTGATALPRLPGGLHDTDELWRALERWAPVLRPHAVALIAECSPAVGRFLEGELPPLPAPPAKDAPGPAEDLHAQCAFAERLALALGLQGSLPPRVLVRFEAGRKHLGARPDGPWIEEDLEALFDLPADVGRVNPARTAAELWVKRASPRRRLQRLDVLSRFSSSDVVGPMLQAVLAQGTREQRREALIRGALRALDHSQEIGDATRARLRRYAAMPAAKLARRWTVLWSRGLLGYPFRREPFSGGLLEPLYAELLDDECAPARWRAVAAVDRSDAALFETRLQDPFLAVRVEALAKLWRLRQWGDRVSSQAVFSSLRSASDAERWAAFVLVVDERRTSLEELLDMVPPREPRTRAPRQDLRPWERTVAEHGAEALSTLHAYIRRAVRSEEDVRTVFARLETILDEDDIRSLFEPFGEWSQAARAALHWLEPGHAPAVRALLGSGMPLQRRFAARWLFSSYPRPPERFEWLAPYAEDPDPEIANLGKWAVHELQRAEESERRRKEGDEASRQQLAEDQRRKNRPILRPEQMSRFTSFEELWEALPHYNLPLVFDDFAPRRLRPAHQDSGAEPHADTSVLSLFRRHHVTQRLLQLYEPRHQSILIEALRDHELARFAAPILREPLPIPALLPLVCTPDRALAAEIDIVLGGTPQGEEAARLLRDELLSGSLDELFSDSYVSGSLRFDRQGGILWAPGNRLALLDGLAGLLPLMEPETPEWLRRDAIKTARSQSDRLIGPAHERPEVLAWACDHENSEDGDVRKIALNILAVAARAEDAERWRSVLNHAEVPAPLLLAAAVRIVARFVTAADRERFRELVTHSPGAGSEAVVALARAASGEELETLVKLLESPPENLARSPPAVADWRGAIAKAVFERGTGAQAKRVAKRMGPNERLGERVAHDLRLPEHLLLVIACLTPDPSEGKRQQTDDPLINPLRDLILRVGEESARRVLVEAAFWAVPTEGTFEQPFRHYARALFERVGEGDVELLVEALRRRPADPLAIRWLAGLARGEETLVAIWSEGEVAWWPHPRAANRDGEASRIRNH